MPSAIEEQLLEAEIAEVKDKAGQTSIAAGEDAATRGAGATRGRAKYDKNGGRFQLFNVKTGETSHPPVAMLASVLGQKDEDGNRVWQVEKPKTFQYDADPKLSRKFGLEVLRLKPPKGSPEFWCPLSPKSDEWKELNGIGYALPCNRSSPLRTYESKWTHFEHRHPQAYRAWQRHEDSQAGDRQENSTVALLEALAKMVSERPASA